jgi:hypothetical protein
MANTLFFEIVRSLSQTDSSVSQNLEVKPKCFWELYGRYRRLQPMGQKLWPTNVNKY